MAQYNPSSTFRSSACKSKNAEQEVEIVLDEDGNVFEVYSEHEVSLELSDKPITDAAAGPTATPDPATPAAWSRRCE